MKLVAVDQAKMTARYEFEAKAEFANPTGAIQGGFLAAMLDEAMSATAIIASNVTMNAPTLEMKISFLRPLFVGKASAEARILKWGKSTCFIEAELFDPEGRLVLHAQPALYTLDGLTGVKKPLGLHADRLGVHIHVVAADGSPGSTSRMSGSASPPAGWSATSPRSSSSWAVIVSSRGTSMLCWQRGATRSIRRGAWCCTRSPRSTRSTDSPG